jgi:uncharacterized membrane protein
MVPASEERMIQHFFEWLEHDPWIVAMNTSASISAVLEVIHYFSFFVLIGAIAIVDLRILGLAGRRQSAAQLSRTVFPWIWTGLGLAVLSGFLMFSGNARQYLHNTIFHRKLLVILLAVIFASIVQQNTARWDRRPAMPVVAKLVALISLLLWVGAILMGVDVPAITGVG